MNYLKAGTYTLSATVMPEDDHMSGPLQICANAELCPHAVLSTELSCLQADVPAEATASTCCIWPFVIRACLLQCAQQSCMFRFWVFNGVSSSYWINVAHCLRTMASERCGTKQGCKIAVFMTAFRQSASLKLDTGQSSSLALGYHTHID